MKKKNELILAISCLTALGLLLGTAFYANADGKIPLTECLNNPELNNGRCLVRADGLGYSCIINNHFWQSDNCYRSTIVEPGTGDINP